MKTKRDQLNREDPAIDDSTLSEGPEPVGLLAEEHKNRERRSPDVELRELSRDPSDPAVSLGKITPAEMSAPEVDDKLLAERGVEKAQEELAQEGRRKDPDLDSGK